jgi:Fe-S cluster assembly protein SufD
VPANSEVSEPVRIKRTYSGSQFAAPHTLIVTGANSRVTIVQEYFSSDDEMVVTPAVEIIPGPGSEIRLYSLHRWGAKTQVFEHQRFLAKADGAELQSLNIVLGGQVVKSHLESSLIGRGTASELLGIGYGKGQTHSDFYTVQDHIGPDTRSDLLVKSALTDEARAVYYGLTRVGLGAKNADANQENRNLLLSKTAKADSDPVLEILTNDVIRVSHGATAGPVDQEQLFYMQARGIPHGEAESMLVTAFLEAVLGPVPNETLRQELSDLLEEALD